MVLTAANNARLSRRLLWALIFLYILPGLFARSPWKQEDASGFDKPTRWPNCRFRIGLIRPLVTACMPRAALLQPGWVACWANWRYGVGCQFNGWMTPCAWATLPG